MEEEANTKALVLTKEEDELRTKRYGQLRDMMDVKTKSMPHFSMSVSGEQSWLAYIDNSERIMNGYTPDRASQGKEDWQSNGFDNITRAKLRAFAAGVGLKMPEMKYVASNKKGLRSKARSELMYQTVRHSFLDGNPTTQSFKEVWQLLSHGVVFEYDGYMTGGCKQKVVESFNSETGEVKWKEEYVQVDGKPFNVILTPNEFYWADMHIEDVQKQPRLAWLQRYSKTELETEFSKFKNYKYVVNHTGGFGMQTEQSTEFSKAWNDRVDKEQYEVFRFYTKEDGGAYEIWIDGVPLLIAPLLWGDKEPYYPFAKTVFEPYANTNFFVGMSFPGLLEAWQEMQNATVNTIVDKFYRSLKRPMLVGLGNKDLLDTQAEMTDQDDKIYVPDVTQVKEYPFEGVNQGDFAMWQAMERSIERLSISASQQGIPEGDVTARATIIADERARQLKGIAFMFLEDLWLQKHRLRVQTILTQYIKDKAKRTSFKDRIISVPDVVFNDGARGTLDIHIAAGKASLLSVAEIEAREQAAEEQGMTYKIVSMTKEYLNDWEYDFQVIPESLYNTDRLKTETDTKEFVQTVVALDPERFASNKEKFLQPVFEVYGKDIDDYPLPPPAPIPSPMQPGPGGEVVETAPTDMLGLQ